MTTRSRFNKIGGDGVDIVHELEVRVTVVSKNTRNGAMPFGATTESELGAILKERIGCDDLHITGAKAFETE